MLQKQVVLLRAAHLKIKVYYIAYTLRKVADPTSYSDKKATHQLTRGGAYSTTEVREYDKCGVTIEVHVHNHLMAHLDMQDQLEDQLKIAYRCLLVQRA